MMCGNFELSDKTVSNYLSSLVNQFFKILPIKESGEKTLPVYIKSLRNELLGCRGLCDALRDDGNIVTLLAILQFLIDNDCSVSETKTEVFKAINICNKLKGRYGAGVVR